MVRVERWLLLSMLVAMGAWADVRVDPPRDPDAQRSAWRWIGLSADPNAAACPEPSPQAGWTTQALFPGTDNRALARFCVYETSWPQPAPPHVDGLVRLERDAMAVLPSGSALEDAVGPAMVAHFLSQAGDFEPPSAGPASVRLAVVDTAATRDSGGENFVGTSPHGYALLNLAKRLSCAGIDESACAAQVSARLALGWECFDRERRDAACHNLAEGGLFGLISEMASAIHAEVQRWRAVGPGRLVINLSIGWGPAWGGQEALVTDMPVPVAAVYMALEDAVCRGAWVLAAAGNREGGPTPEIGPIFPASWETRPAPSFATCTALGLAPSAAHFPAPGAGGVYRPLVYGVGGVRADDLLLANSRPLAAPPLAAFGDHAVVATLGGPRTEALTGSSVATLVASVATALAAYYRPDLRPFELVQAVYQGGRDLGRRADFCQGGSPCPQAALAVRRVTSCETLAYVCRNGGGLCPASLPACPLAQALELGAVNWTAFDVGAIKLDLTALTSLDAPLSECRGERLRHAPLAAPVDPCPHWQYYARSPARATEPQPGSYPCPNCTYGVDAGSVYVEIDPSYEGELSAATLKCGEQTWSVGGPEPWVAGDQAEIQNVVCPAGENLQLAFTVDGVDSATSPVLREP
jgi:hypothetical protein